MAVKTPIGKLNNNVTVMVIKEPIVAPQNPATIAINNIVVAIGAAIVCKKILKNL